jgi:hypothetical protein
MCQNSPVERVESLSHDPRRVDAGIACRFSLSFLLSLISSPPLAGDHRRQRVLAPRVPKVVNTSTQQTGQATLILIPLTNLRSSSWNPKIAARTSKPLLFRFRHPFHVYFPSSLFKVSPLPFFRSRYPLPHSFVTTHPLFCPGQLLSSSHGYP